ncbi:MAG: PEP-CTERM sorting domain-containing protein [Planctomycetota bacterium]
MRVKSLIALLVLASASVARAEFVLFDSPGNNGIATADPLVSDIGIVNARLAGCSASSDIGIGSLAAGGGDVDYYSISLPAGCWVTGITTPVDPAFFTPDTTFAAYDNAGNEIVWNDDAGTNSSGNAFGGSAWRFETTYSGIYYVAVSGYADGVLNATPMDGLDDFTGGPHVEQGTYGLTISVFPEPSSLALIGLGAVALLRRRK